MVFGMSFETFTNLHVVLSLIGIVSGLVAFSALARNVWLGSWHHVFLATTLATVITGFMFPISSVTPALIVGGVALALLAVAYIALFQICQAAWSGRAYAVTGMISLYLNLFVLVAQGFMKVPFLNALAPTQSEAPFALAQLVLLIASIALGYYATTGIQRRAA